MCVGEVEAGGPDWPGEAVDRQAATLHRTVHRGAESVQLLLDLYSKLICFDI